MPRGGPRQATPGKAYSNRTDLATNYSPQEGTTTAAAGGVQTSGQERRYTTPDDIPKLDDPTARPDEPITAGLPIGPGPGREALGGIPVNPMIADLKAAYVNNPTPQLARAIRHMQMKGM